MSGAPCRTRVADSRPRNALSAAGPVSSAEVRPAFRARRTAFRFAPRSACFQMASSIVAERREIDPEYRGCAGRWLSLRLGQRADVERTARHLSSKPSRLRDVQVGVVEAGQIGERRRAEQRWHDGKPVLPLPAIDVAMHRPPGSDEIRTVSCGQTAIHAHSLVAGQPFVTM